MCVSLFVSFLKAANHGGSTLPTDLSLHIYVCIYIFFSLYFTGGAYDMAQTWGSKGILRESVLLSTCGPGA